MTPDPFRIPEDWYYERPSKVPGAAASGDVASARPVRRSGRGNTFHRAVALAALAICVELLWPSIRGGAG